MASELRSVSEHHYVLTKLQHKVAGSISRRSLHRRKLKVTRASSESSVASGITVSRCTGSLGIFSEDGNSFAEDGNSFSEDGNSFAEEGLSITEYDEDNNDASLSYCGPAERDIPIGKLTIDVTEPLTRTISSWSA
jgi:hypothetical protein